jgi:hypothetical protein
MRNVYTVLAETPERKRPLEKPRRRWEYNSTAELIFMK